MMANEEIRIKSTDAKLNDQGEKVLKDLLELGKDVVIGASAGTGKTTLLTNILAEVIIREIENQNPNPLDSIVAVTFTVEAARQMKEKTREILTAYKHKLSNFDELIYNLEIGSWITTIDALTQRIIRIIALDIGLPPEIGIVDEFDNAQILSDVFEKLSMSFPNEIQFLELATRKRTLEIFSNVLASLALYVIDLPTLIKRMKQSFTSFYSPQTGLEPDLQAIERYNQQVMDSIEKLLPVFVTEVRTRYRQEGSYTYDELRRLVVTFLRTKKASEWCQYFDSRFKFILIDEFQDTSIAQTELLSRIAGLNTRIMIIGDPKQSIYTWRNAEPTILSEIIESATSNKLDAHFKRIFNYHAITENFRSVKPLVELNNFFFSDSVTDSLFEDKGFTRGLSLPNPEIKASTPHPANKPEDSPHIHYFFASEKNQQTGVKYSEPKFVAHLLGKLANGTLDIRVRKKENEKWVWTVPKLGDCAVLIPRRGPKWYELRNLFIERNIHFVMLNDQGFYQRPEISLLIDFLDWLGDPYKNEALLRILRSPFVGASDFLLRTLASNKFRFDNSIKLLEKKARTIHDKKMEIVIKRDLLALKRVMNLKRNLRWSREGRKAVLLEAILQSSHFREILMTYHEGEQCVANLGLLCDTVDSWEKEEIISYQNLVRRLKFYRSAKSSHHSQAVLSDLENEDAVKVSTIHSTKGLEFPIVFILDVDVDTKLSWRSRNSGYGIPARLIYAGSSGKFIHLRQFTPPRAPTDLWKQLSTIYSREQVGTTGFLKKMAEIYDAFFAEKWRLYYVAMTRARDHIFHGYNSAGGTAPKWGNEFRGRISKFVESDAKRKTWVSLINGPPTSVHVKSPPHQIIKYSPNQTLQEISGRFYPLVIDPTHVYDLLLCPRRYQYGSLMGASGAKCNETGHSQFSPLFGGILHEMLEMFDYTNNDATLALELLSSKDYLSQYEQDLLTDAVQKYTAFINTDLGYISGSTHVVSEKSIHACFNLSGRTTELRGIIDLLDVSGNTINIYDFKSNYLTSDTNDPSNVALRKEFMRHHHEYQLLTYKAMLETQGYQVGGVYVLAISKNSTGNLQWDLVTVKPNVQIIDELKHNLPLDVDDGGLPTKKNKFCPICEYKYMCGV